MIALSHVADGCAARAQEDPAGARTCVERVYRRARRLPAQSGLARTHLLLILGAGDRTGPRLDPKRHHTLAESLAAGSLADPALAARWWEPYRTQYLVDRGVLVGFREWPPGVDRRANVDSAPIVEGVGVAATAFGIGPGDGG